MYDTEFDDCSDMLSVEAFFSSLWRRDCCPVLSKRRLKLDFGDTKAALA